MAEGQSDGLKDTKVGSAHMAGLCPLDFCLLPHRNSARSIARPCGENATNTPHIHPAHTGVGSAHMAKGHEGWPRVGLGTWPGVCVLWQHLSLISETNLLASALARGQNAAFWPWPLLYRALELLGSASPSGLGQRTRTYRALGPNTGRGAIFRDFLQICLLATWPDRHIQLRLASPSFAKLPYRALGLGPKDTKAQVLSRALKSS